MSESLAPAVTDLSRPFWNAASEGRFALPYCVATGCPFWPPAPTSPFRTAGAVEWRDAEAVGIVSSIVVYRRAFQSALAAHLPYGIALVQVARGVRLLVHLDDPDAAPKPGSRVSLCFRRLAWSETPVLAIAPQE